VSGASHEAEISRQRSAPRITIQPVINLAESRLDRGEINAAQGRVEQPERHNDGIAKSEVSAFQVSFDRFGDTPRSERAGLRPASSRLQCGMAQELRGVHPLQLSR
jgi:hypothetical protein